MSAEPVGAVEIAERLGVRRQTVDNWRQRPIGFPAPRWTVGGRPAWDWPAVKQWAQITGRLEQQEETMTVTDAQIEALRSEAGTAGDTAQARICDAALAGDDAARAECARVIAEAKAAGL